MECVCVRGISWGHLCLQESQLYIAMLQNVHEIIICCGGLGLSEHPRQIKAMLTVECSKTYPLLKPTPCSNLGGRQTVVARSADDCQTAIGRSSDGRGAAV